MRIRYASRTNVDKLYNQYDAAAKGYIDAKDIADMSTHLGIKITLDQAQVLVQSAKNTEGSDKGLSVDEFTNLVFSGDDAMRVDLSKLKPMSSAKLSTKSPTGHSAVGGNDQMIEN